MNFKPELLAKVLAGEKTQTRRPVHDGDGYFDLNRDGFSTRYTVPSGFVDTVIDGKSGRVRYEVGRIYAVCPGRGKSGQGFIRLTRIRYEDVRCINHEDTIAEGFTSPFAFWLVWCGFYVPNVMYKLQGWQDLSDMFGEDSGAGTAATRKWLLDRPADNFLAWALTFELVK